MRSVSVGMGAILPLGYPSHCVLRSAPLVVLTSLLGAFFLAEPVATLEEPILALAWLDDTKLALLSPVAVSVHRVERSRFVRIARQELPGPLFVVRHPGGLVLPGDDAFWVLTSGMPRAVLYALDGERLVERVQADALPWPEVSGGLRYRDGTNLLESAAGLLLTPIVDSLAVDPSGHLLLLSPLGPIASSLRAGPTLAALGNGRWAVSSAAPPGAPDSVQIVERAGDDLRLRTSLPVPGSVRALGARRSTTEPRLAVALETAPGETVVLLLRLRPGS